MDFEIITIFPDLIEAMAPYGVIGRARQPVAAPMASPALAASPASPATRAVPASPAPLVPPAAHPRPGAGAYFLRCWNPRDYTFDNYRRIDDRPYGGGPGMVMLAEPLVRCLQALRETREREGRAPLPLIYLSPQGQHFSQPRAQRLARSPGAILLCGRYEAIDQRFLDAEVDEEISMGDFVVSGGELPAMLLLDAVVRLLPGVLNHGASAEQDSFADGAPAQRLLDCPHYTRPEVLPPGLVGEVDPAVPAVLLSGNHRDIDRWRHERALEATRLKRPDLLAGRGEVPVGATGLDVGQTGSAGREAGQED